MANSNRTGWIIIGVVCVMALVSVAGFIAFLRIEPAPLELSDYVVENSKEVAVTPKSLGLIGTLIVEADSGVEAINVETGETKNCLQLAEGESVFALAGPNKSGIAAVVLSNMMGQRHRLVRLDLKNETEKTILDRKGDALRDNAIGWHIAIASEADVAYVIVPKKQIQLYHPSSYISEGELQRIDLNSGQVTVTADRVLDSDFSCGADGNTVWYTAATDRKLAKELPSPDPIYNSWSRYPVVFEKRSSTPPKPLVAAWGALLDNKGKKLIPFGHQTAKTVMNLETKGVEALQIPPYVYGIVYFSDDLYVGRAPQLKASDVEFTQSNGLPGPRPMDRVIAIRAKTSETSKLYDSIDPRDVFSFGAWSR
jgi:hypothetical protein